MSLKTCKAEGSTGSLAGDVSFFFSHILVPVVVLSIYLVVSSFLLPEGVNRVFVTRSARYLLPVAGLLCAVLLVFLGPGRRRLRFLPTDRDRVSAGDLTLLLLPMAPVTQYLLSNDGILAWWEVLLVFGFFALLVALPTLVVPALLWRSGATRPVMYLGAAFAYTILSMASLSRQFAWHEWGSLRIQLPILGGVWLFTWILFRLHARDLLHGAIAVYFVVNAILQARGGEGAPTSEDAAPVNASLADLVGTSKPPITPNIYLLVYDSYVVSETMAAYGIDNRDQERYLEERGFKIYPETYSVAGKTLTTMGRVLNASLDIGGPTRRASSGDGVVQNLLEGFGYRTFGVFPSGFHFRGVVPSYDYSFPAYGPSMGVLSQAILEGEFRFEVGIDEASWEQFAVVKRRVLAEESDSPKFLYAHSNWPSHSQDSGVCLPNEMDLFAERLARANLEMRQDIELALANDPTAIVIVAGDHGPYLTKNCLGTGEVYPTSEISRLDVQDRLGTFLAIRWPSGEYEAYDEITVLQDLFPAIFAYLFADPGMLDSRIESASVDVENVSGVKIVDGVIVGGIDDGEPLFLGGG